MYICFALYGVRKKRFCSTLLPARSYNIMFAMLEIIETKVDKYNRKIC